MQRKACFMSLAILLVLSANASAGSFMKSFNKGNGGPSKGAVVRDHRTTSAPIVRDHRNDNQTLINQPIVRDHRQPDLTNVVGKPVTQPVKKPPITTTVGTLPPGTLLPVYPVNPIKPPKNPVKPNPPKGKGNPTTGDPTTGTGNPTKGNGGLGGSIPWDQVVGQLLQGGGGGDGGGGASGSDVADYSTPEYSETTASYEQPATQAQPVAEAPVAEEQAAETLRLTPGMEITISGTDFGADQGKVAVKVGDLILLAEIVTWQADAVAVRLPVMLVAKPMPAELMVARADRTLVKEVPFELTQAEAK